MFSGLGVLDFAKKVIQASKDRMDKSVFRNYENYRSKTATLLDPEKVKHGTHPNLMHKRLRARRRGESIKIMIIAIFTVFIALFVIYYWIHSVNLVYGD